MMITCQQILGLYVTCQFKKKIIRKAITICLYFQFFIFTLYDHAMPIKMALRPVCDKFQTRRKERSSKRGNKFACRHSKSRPAANCTVLPPGEFNNTILDPLCHCSFNLLQKFHDK